MLRIKELLEHKHLYQSVSLDVKRIMLIIKDEGQARLKEAARAENWRVTSQSERAVSLAGKPPIPWIHLCMVVIGFAACVVPGIILYVMLIRKVVRFQNMVVTATAVGDETDVSITHPPHAKQLVAKFLTALPRSPTPLHETAAETE